LGLTTINSVKKDFHEFPLLEILIREAEEFKTHLRQLKIKSIASKHYIFGVCSTF